MWPSATGNLRWTSCKTDAGVVIRADLPGVRKEDVAVEVKDNLLSLSGSRSPEDASTEERYLKRERCSGTFHRAFSLQGPVRPDKIRAVFKDGVLEIFVARTEEERHETDSGRHRLMPHRGRGRCFTKLDVAPPHTCRFTDFTMCF